MSNVRTHWTRFALQRSCPLVVVFVRLWGWRPVLSTNEVFLNDCYESNDCRTFCRCDARQSSSPCREKGLYALQPVSALFPFEIHQALMQIGKSLAWPQPLTIRASASHENDGFLAFDMSRSISFAR